MRPPVKLYYFLSDDQIYCFVFSDYQQLQQNPYQSKQSLGPPETEDEDNDDERDEVNTLLTEDDNISLDRRIVVKSLREYARIKCICVLYLFRWVR